jgi:hypothetical protein
VLFGSTPSQTEDVMKTTPRLLAAAIFAIALPISASGQETPPPPPPTPPPAAPAAPAAPGMKLEVGKWTGAVTPPGSEAIDIEFNVTVVSDTMKIELSIPQVGMTAPLTAIKLEEKAISFDFDAGGTPVTCKLDKKEDGSYSGQCADAGGNGGPMTMVPPKKNAGGTSGGTTSRN